MASDAEILRALEGLGYDSAEEAIRAAAEMLVSEEDRARPDGWYRVHVPVRVRRARNYRVGTVINIAHTVIVVRLSTEREGDEVLTVGRIEGMGHSPRVVLARRKA